MARRTEKPVYLLTKARHIKLYSEASAAEIRDAVCHCRVGDKQWSYKPLDPPRKSEPAPKPEKAHA